MGGEGNGIGKVEWGIERKVNSGEIREDKKRVLRSLVQSRICKGHTEPDRERFYIRICTCPSRPSQRVYVIHRQRSYTGASNRIETNCLTFVNFPDLA